MIRFLEANDKSVAETDKDCDYLVMDGTIWKQGREYFKTHRSADKISVKDKDGKFLCYAYQDADANRELRMLEELSTEEGVLHFEDIYQQYHSVAIQECNELAYFFAGYLKGRGIAVKVSGKYWDEIAKWEEQETEGAILTIYAEGTWGHNKNLSYELLRTVSVEFEYIDRIYMENIRTGRITNAKCGYREWIGRLKDRNIILIGTGNRVQDIYDMLVAEGLDITGFLSDRIKDGLKLLGKEIIRTEDIEKYSDPVFIEIGKNSALGMGNLDEYVYFYGHRRNENYFFFQDYAQIQRNNLQHVLEGKRLLLAGEKYLSGYIKENMIGRGKEADSIQYLEETEESFINDDVIGVVVILRMFGLVDSVKKWKSEVDLCIQALKERNVRNYTLYFTISSAVARIESREEKFEINELRPKGIVIGAINAFSGNVFFRDCIDNHPNIIQFGFTSFENDLFWYCICCSQMPVNEIVSNLFNMLRKQSGEYWFSSEFPNPEIFRARCESVLEGRKKVTPQELFVLFAVAYNEMRGRKISDIRQTYIYWEPHMQDVPLRLLYAEWIADKKTKSFAVYLTRNSLISAGSALMYAYRSNQKTDLLQMEAALLNVPYILDEEEGADNRIILRFEDLKLTPGETWKKFCERLDIPWSETLLETTRFGEESYFNNGEKKIIGYDLTPVYRDYAELFSPFDKMRICFCKAEYQKKYGYPYDDTPFSRKELQELYLKKFKCQDVLEINAEENEGEILRAYKYVQNRLNERYIDSLWENFVDNEDSLMI